MNKKINKKMAATLLVKVNATKEQILRALSRMVKLDVVQENGNYKITAEHFSHLDSYAYYQCLNSETLIKWLEQFLIYYGVNRSELGLEVIEASQTEYYTKLDGTVIVGRDNYDFSYP